MAVSHHAASYDSTKLCLRKIYCLQCVSLLRRQILSLHTTCRLEYRGILGGINVSPLIEYKTFNKLSDSLIGKYNVVYNIVHLLEAIQRSERCKVTEVHNYT